MSRLAVPGPHAVSPPRAHLTRFHGVFAPNAHLRVQNRREPHCPSPINPQKRSAMTPQPRPSRRSRCLQLPSRLREQGF